MRTTIAMICGLAVCAVVAAATCAWAQAEAASSSENAAAARVVVLDTRGFWRMHQTLSPPVVDLGGTMQPVLVGSPSLDEVTPEPPAGWMKPDFDDGTWLRAPALRSCKTSYLSRLCLRGTLAVSDPSKVQDLKLSVDFHGGAIVYLNGEEVVRGGVAKGADRESALGEPYPREAFVGDGGKLATVEGWRNLSDKERKRLREARLRALDGVAIPAAMLRKGVNVLAVELIRSPYDAVLDEQKKQKGEGVIYEVPWNTCELRRVQLTAATADGLTPNATRPEGFQAWNSDPLASDFDMDWGDANAPLRPILLAATRGGVFSGKVVVGSTQPIEGLRATPGDLTSGDAKIPASAIRVRYAARWGDEYIRIPYGDQLAVYPRDPGLLSALEEAPRSEYPVVTREASRYDLPLKDEPAPVFGAVVPVWVTVHVPRDARPGLYKGEVRIEAKGRQPIAAAIEVSVSDWLLPETKDWRTWVEMVQSPDTLSVEYDVPMWSEAHWKMIACSMDFMGEAGSRVVYVPLIAETNQGNAQSMVRWIRKADGKYAYDFSVMERYLDTAEKHLGQPKLVICNVWEVYIIQKEEYSKSKGQEERAIKYLESRNALKGTGPAVTLLDEKTGKTETVYLPPYGDEASRALWAPLFKELRARLAKRGLADAMMLGTISDARPTKEQVTLFHEVAEGVPWVCHSHHGWGPGDPVWGMEPVLYQTRVWNIGFQGDPSKERMYGWKLPYLLADYERHREINGFPSTTWRHMGEFNITGTQRGIGRVGADFWQAIKDPRGGRNGTVAARYPQSSRRNLDLYSSVLAPGPDGPVATQHYEAFREGIEECEARIFIERALVAPELKEKLGEDLAGRCQAALDERLFCMWRGLNNLQITGPHWYYLNWRGDPSVAGSSYFLSSDWRPRTAKLFDLAGEVARKLGPSAAAGRAETADASAEGRS